MSVSDEVISGSVSLAGTRESTNTMANQPKPQQQRKRITPQLVQPAADQAGAEHSSGAARPGATWRLPPAVAPADPNAPSALGPGRHVHVDLKACGTMIDLKDVGACLGHMNQSKSCDAPNHASKTWTA